MFILLENVYIKLFLYILFVKNLSRMRKIISSSLDWKKVIERKGLEITILVRGANGLCVIRNDIEKYNRNSYGFSGYFATCEWVIFPF